ncbi:hypothetical protein [Escherichia albertii]|nr:hypothetical protein [Escherichia albertii]EKG0290543.1 hypothetical protein [Escherichia albertii]MCZ8798250.1 hypothetical protein [Escherichia albertii]
MRKHHIRHRAPDAGCGVNALSCLQVRHDCRPDKMRKHRIWHRARMPDAA